MCRLSLDACSCFELLLLAACRFELSFARVLALFGFYRNSCSFFGCRVSALVKHLLVCRVPFFICHVSVTVLGSTFLCCGFYLLVFYRISSRFVGFDFVI